MKIAARFVLERLATFDRAIRDGEYPNAGTIARKLEVCRRTVQRDVEFLRDRLHAPLDFDRNRNGYFYHDPSFKLPFLALTEHELVALSMAGRILDQYGRTPHGPDLARALCKITAGLGEDFTDNLGRLGSSYTFRSTALARTDPCLFTVLESAIRLRRRVSIRYWSASSDEETVRDVDPYTLALVDGRWFVVGHCHLRGEVRTFLPGRIREFHLGEVSFEVPSDFQAEDYLSKAFGVICGKKDDCFRVRLRFRGDAVRYARERPWHPSQTEEATSDGGVILTFEVGHLLEIERFALAWGSDCEVLGPVELRARVAAALRIASARYDEVAPVPEVSHDGPARGA